VQLTRVLREAVSNLIRHSGASRCRIEVAWNDGRLTLCIEDDGRGLPPASNGVGQAGATSEGGHGLLNIERRALGLGGSHRFGTSRWGGALVAVEVPLEAAT
jgi:signal transduction histidine kinase